MLSILTKRSHILLKPSIQRLNIYVLRLIDGFLLNLLQKVGAWLSMPVVGPIAVLFASFLFSGFRLPLNHLLFLNLCMFHCYITMRRQKTHMRIKHGPLCGPNTFLIWRFIRIKSKVSSDKTGLGPQYFFYWLFHEGNFVAILQCSSC